MLVLDDSYHIVTIDQQWKVLVDHAIRFAQAIERHRGPVLLEFDKPVNMPLERYEFVFGSMGIPKGTLFRFTTLTGHERARLRCRETDAGSNCRGATSGAGAQA